MRCVGVDVRAVLVDGKVCVHVRAPCVCVRKTIIARLPTRVNTHFTQYCAHIENAHHCWWALHVVRVVASWATRNARLLGYVVPNYHSRTHRGHLALSRLRMVGSSR